ncbi:MAG: excinuclease ABC subunit UvrC [Dehalococcoidia bacterium]|nr:excinuclease ABC subunit UvrC [Dehalococcoidia bacterium]
METKTTSQVLTQQVKTMPQKPGVYLMRNEKGEVIYVGKATNLKNRVRSYFGSARSLEPKTRILREHITNIEYIICANPGEALILEATLIKRHQPFFNIRLKDDKRYPYLKIDVQNDWPRVYITRRIEKDGARYFGPYANAGSIRSTLDLLKKLFPYRSCTKPITGNDPRPCLDYYIKRCIAPCTSYCSREEYTEVVNQIIMFLEGKSDTVLKQLQSQMQSASDSMDYERAAMLRDQITALANTMERQMLATTKKEDLDIFGIARDKDHACVQVFFVRGTSMTGRDHFVLEGTSDEKDETILESFLQQYYESAQFIPKLIIVPFLPDGLDDLEQILSTKKGTQVKIRIAKRGEKHKLSEMASENAHETLVSLKQQWLSDKTKVEIALQEIQEELALSQKPNRIECYDNSNLQGTHAVSSMVVFENGSANKKQYRKFKIKTVAGADDFASMREVLNRRFKKAADQFVIAAQEASEETNTISDDTKWALPDLVIVDGGKGQLSAAVKTMRELGIYHIPVAGLAKRHEEIFLPDEDNPIILKENSEALYLIQRIRDEAHRFAITYHRKLRNKAAQQSALDTIPGIGPKRKKALLRKFGSLKALREAETDQIAATIGFTRRLAETVKEHI